MPGWTYGKHAFYHCQWAGVVRDSIKLRQTRPFVAKNQPYIVPKKSLFNWIIGDRGFELTFARFLEECPEGEILSWAKNFLAIPFKLDYINAKGEPDNYNPDFFVKLPGDRMVLVETKGLEELDLPRKMARLRQWCEDINRAQKKMLFDFVYVDQIGFEKFQPKTFQQVLDGFRQYK